MASGEGRRALPARNQIVGVYHLSTSEKNMSFPLTERGACFFYHLQPCNKNPWAYLLKIAVRKNIFSTSFTLQWSVSWMLKNISLLFIINFSTMNRAWVNSFWRLEQLVRNSSLGAPSKWFSLTLLGILAFLNKLGSGKAKVMKCRGAKGPDWDRIYQVIILFLKDCLGSCQDSNTMPGDHSKIPKAGKRLKLFKLVNHRMPGGQDYRLVKDCPALLFMVWTRHSCRIDWVCKG